MLKNKKYFWTFSSFFYFKRKSRISWVNRRTWSWICFLRVLTYQVHNPTSLNTWHFHHYQHQPLLCHDENKAALQLLKFIICEWFAFLEKILYLTVMPLSFVGDINIFSIKSGSTCLLIFLNEGVWCDNEGVIS